MRQLVLLITLIVPALTACSPPHCEVDGVQHNIGDSWTCADGCNSCTCTEDGVSQTNMACSPPHCEVDGVQHNIGDSWTCADGCNTCECTADGVNQTDMACNTDTGGGDDTDDTSTSAE